MSDISPELVERMVQLVRGLAASDNWGPFATLSDVIQEARAIAGELPVPADPDLIEARAISLEYSLPAILHGLTSCRVMSGKADATTSVKVTLAAIKRGRELAESSK